jgi:hypothetical protein
MEQMRSNQPLFLRCLEYTGNSSIPTVLTAKMALRAMDILLQSRKKFNCLAEAIYLLSIAMAKIESSIRSIALEHCIANEELFDQLKRSWSDFCAQFVEYLCFAQTIPFAVSVSVQMVSTIIPLLSSKEKSNIAVLWSGVAGMQRVFESVPTLSSVSNLANLRRACITSELPLPLVKSYMALADGPTER